MLTNFWRYSHLLLALFSSVFILVAAITGIILSTQPLVNHINSPSHKFAADTLNLAHLVPQLKDEYIAVFSLSIDEENAVKIDVIGFDENADGAFYIDPNTGVKIAEIPPKNEIYNWVTILHRSLFIHSTGRVLMGITVFLLFLMALSGIALVIKRTNGLRYIFTTLKKENTAQYYHTVLGRISFIPLVLMALSGTILFLNTSFKTPENSEIQHKRTKRENIEAADFPIFKSTLLTEVKTLNFPFSGDEEDYFELILHNKTLKIQQYTGEIIVEKHSTWIQSLAALSMTLHTGRGQWIWSVVLGLISINLLYFMYSGTKIAWKRMSTKTRNKVSSNEAEFIILVGSENGTTRQFVNQLYTALLNSKKSVFVDEMNSYQLYPKAKHLIVMSSTYGDGDAPFNARNFISKVESIGQNKILKTHVIGFGSMMYPKFCQFAIDVHHTFSKNENFETKTGPTLIDGRSQTSFTLSIEEWKKRHSIKLELPKQDHKKPVIKTKFKVIQKHSIDDGYVLTFTLELIPLAKVKFQSGDLFAFVPPGNDVVRYYSIGKTLEGNILLSIKKHDFGECSRLLFKKEIGEEISAYIKDNSKFHFPKKDNILMIANGTGIAPFLGMDNLYSKQKKTYLLGGRNRLSFKLYYEIINQQKSIELSNNFYFALSKEDDNSYVQDLVFEQKKEVIQLLKNKGSIMICGSIKMRDGVLEVLKSILEEEGLAPLEKYIEKNKILMDCY